MDRLQDRFSKLLQEVSTDFHRYMYHQINWNNRMIGLTGPRGVGKTMLILQYLKENLPRENSLYVTAEDFYFVEHRLLDLADLFVKQGGKHLFIDEIHYQNFYEFPKFRIKLLILILLHFNIVRIIY